jgi:hypothetical protein
MVNDCETTTIWLDDKCEPRDTLGWGERYACAT